MSTRAVPQLLEERLASIDEHLRRLRSFQTIGSTDAYVLVATFDAVGDLIIGTGDNAYTRLAIGPVGTALTVTADGLAWSSSVLHNHESSGAFSTVVGGTGEADPGAAIAAGEESAAFGDYAEAVDDFGIAIGPGIGAADYSDPVNPTTYAALAYGIASLAMGGSDTNDITQGMGAAAMADYGIAFGLGSVARREGAASIAFGIRARAGSGTGTAAIAIGSSADPSLFNGAVAAGARSIAIGGSDGVFTAPETGDDDAIAMGTSAQALYATSTAIGWFALTGDIDATAIGPDAQALGSESTAIGPSSYATGAQSSAYGILSLASAASTSAFGNSAEATAARASSFGERAQAIAADASAFGSQVHADYSHSTGLGADAVTLKANQLMLGTISDVLTFPGGMEWHTETKTNTDYTLTGQDTKVRFSTGAVNRVATLPPATAANIGLTFIIKKIDAGAGIVTVTADTSGTPDLIDGAATYVLAAQYDSIMLQVGAADTWDIV